MSLLSPGYKGSCARLEEGFVNRVKIETFARSIPDLVNIGVECLRVDE